MAHDAQCMHQLLGSDVQLQLPLNALLPRHIIIKSVDRGS